MIPGRPGLGRLLKSHFWATKRRCQRINVSGRNDGIELEQRFTSHRLRLPRKQHPLSIGEPDPLASQSFLQEPIFGLKELNKNELTAMNPTRDDHQQKCEQRWDRTHARSLPRTVVRLNGHYAILSDDVAAAVAEVALGQPVVGMIEVAGPDRIRQDELVRQFLGATGDTRKVVIDSNKGYFGIQVNDQSLVPGDNPRLGPTHYEESLKRCTA
jgi:hypothetical protein